MSPRPPFWVAFGKVSAPGTAVRNEGAELVASGAALGRQVARITPETAALRLNSPGWLAPPPDLIGALREREDLRLLCRDGLEALTPGFAAAARRFVAKYLDRAEEMALGHGETPEAPNVAADVFFEALLPLPSAQVLLDDKDAAPARLDLAFWDGDRVLGILFGEANASTPEAQRSLDRLSDRLGPAFTLHRLSAIDAQNRLIESLLAPAFAQHPPWFGPYRAQEFRAPLP